MKSEPQQTQSDEICWDAQPSGDQTGSPQQLPEIEDTEQVSRRLSLTYPVHKVIVNRDFFHNIMQTPYKS